MDSREYTKRLVKETNARLGNQIGDLELRSHIGKKLDIGAFTISAPIVSSSVDTVLPLDTISYGNLTLSDNGGIILAPYKRYRITAFSILNNTITGTHNIVLRMKNVTDGTYLPFMTNTARGSSNCENVIETTKTTEIQIVNNSGTSTTINNLYVVVQEIGREVILDPAEDAKNLEFEHGTVLYNSNSSTISANTMIPYGSHSGNLTIQNGQILLTKGKKYRISVSVLRSVITVAGGYSVFIKNIDNFSIPVVPVSYGGNMSCSGVYPIEVIPQIDMLIYPYMNTSSTNVQTLIEVEEIAHPYYFNYFKDSIGSKILFNEEATSVGTYDLLDDINNYEWISVICGQLWGSKPYSLIEEKNVTVDRIKGIANEYSYNQYSSNSERTVYFHFDKTNNKLSIDGLVEPSGGTYKKMGIIQVIGYGFIYDNPYKDLISSGSSSVETTEEEMNNLTSFS